MPNYPPGVQNAPPAVPLWLGLEPTRVARRPRGHQSLQGQIEGVHQKEKPRILVVARGHLGDILGALPALRGLRQGFRDAHITVIANEYVRGALEQCPFVDEVIYGFTYRSRSRW